MTAVLGVDVGNTTVTVALCRPGKGVDVVPNSQGSRSTPCCIAFTDVETLLGEAARGQLVRNPQNTVVDLLSIMGATYEEVASRATASRWCFRPSKAKDGGVQVDVSLKGEAKSFTPARLLSLLLAHMRAEAEAFAGCAVKEVVIAVPPHFSDVRRAVLKEAAQMGGSERPARA